MSTTTELIERLRKHADIKKSGFTVYEFVKDYIEAADTIQLLSAKLYALQNDMWISCDEKSPEYDKEILLQTKDFGVVVGIYSKVNVCGESKDIYLVHYSIDTDKMVSVEVTGWMPLPEKYQS